MYYAYSISLMYFLRKKNTPETTEDIFNKLKLKEDDKVHLRTLLSKRANQEFTSHEIQTIIEPILGRATRDLAAEHTKDEFQVSPQDSPLFTVAKYGLEYCFKLLLETNGSELSELIDHGFTDPDFTEAEVYRVSGMNRAMGAFAEARFLHVVEEFRHHWAIKEQDLKAQETPLTESAVQHHKANLLDNILRKQTVEFFSIDNGKHLIRYKNHLQKECVWGTEETLFVLHRAIQGERLLRNSKGTIDTIYDNKIPLHLHRNDSSPFIQSGKPAMILNNQDNMHWISKIPDSIFRFKKTTQLTYPGEVSSFLRESKQTGPRVAKVLRQIYQKGLEGNEEYSPENCREIAQQYINYAKHNHRHFNLTDVKHFLEEMNEVIKNKTDIDKSSTVILSSGIQDGALNTSQVQEITPLMLQQHPIPSIDLALRDKSFEKGIDDSTRDVVFFAKKDKRFAHLYSDEGINMLYKTVYDWVDTLTDKSFKSLINSSLKKYESKIWGSLWGASRRSEVEGYLNGNCNAKALAMIFMNGVEASTLNECLFVKIVETIKKEISKFPEMLHDPKYQLIAQFNLEEDKTFYLAHLKYNSETVAALQRQLESTSSLTC